MWEKEYDRDYLLAYNFSKEFITRNCPEEEPYFEKIWQTATHLYDTWSDLGPPREVQEKISKNLEIVRVTKQLKTPRILAIVLTCINLLNMHQPTTIRYILTEVVRISGRGELEEKLEFQLFKDLYEFSKDLGRVSPFGYTHTAQDLLNPDFEFGNELLMSWHKNQPLVILDEKKILGFRSQASLFVTLLYMAAARKTGDGWVHRKKDLRDPQEHRISSLRRIFDSVKVKTIGKVFGKEIIKPDRKGNIKLALKAHNIFIYREIADFRSGNEKMTELLLEECEKWFEEFKKRKEEVVFNTLWRSAQRLMHHYLPLEKDMELARIGAELLGLEFNHLNKYEKIRKKYDDVMDKLGDAAEWHKKLSSKRS